MLALYRFHLLVEIFQAASLCIRSDIHKGLKCSHTESKPISRSGHAPTSPIQSATSQVWGAWCCPYSCRVGSSSLFYQVILKRKCTSNPWARPI